MNGINALLDYFNLTHINTFDTKFLRFPSSSRQQSQVLLSFKVNITLFLHRDFKVKRFLLVLQIRNLVLKQNLQGLVIKLGGEYTLFRWGIETRKFGVKQVENGKCPNEKDGKVGVSLSFLSFFFFFLRWKY